MPYLGDAPSNPVPLTLISGVAVGDASGPTDHDRHVCWFSLPAQAAGNSVRLSTSVSGVPGLSLAPLVLVWDGGNTAHYIGVDQLGARQQPAYRPIPAGVDLLIGVFPERHPTYAGARFSDRDVDQAQTPLTPAGWDDVFSASTDLTKRLPASLQLIVEVEASANPVGTPANPMVMNFTASQDAQTFDLDSWEHPMFAIEPVLPAGYGLEVVSSDGFYQPLVLTGELNNFAIGATTYIKPDPLVADPVLSPVPFGALPSGELSIRAVRIADLSGGATDADGLSAEPCNVLLFRTADALRAVESPSGLFEFSDIPAGDYIAVFFSRADGRDVRATNVLVPPGTRAAGGGYPFVPGP